MQLLETLSQETQAEQLIQMLRASVRPSFVPQDYVFEGPIEFDRYLLGISSNVQRPSLLGEVYQQMELLQKMNPECSNNNLRTESTYFSSASNEGYN